MFSFQTLDEPDDDRRRQWWKIMEAVHWTAKSRALGGSKQDGYSQWSPPSCLHHTELSPWSSKVRAALYPPGPANFKRTETATKDDEMLKCTKATESSLSFPAADEYLCGKEITDAVYKIQKFFLWLRKKVVKVFEGDIFEGTAVNHRFLRSRASSTHLVVWGRNAPHHPTLHYITHTHTHTNVTKICNI